MLRLIKFVIETLDIGLKIEPTIENKVNWNSKFSMKVIGQDIQKKELVSLDLLYTCLTYRFDGDPRLKVASHF
jgi:hypothetical protein